MKPFIVGKVVPEEWEDENAGVGWKPLNPPIQIGLWPMSKIDGIQPESHIVKSDPIGSDNQKNPDRSAIPDHTLDSYPHPVTDSPSNFPGIDHPTTSARLGERLRALEPAPDSPQEASRDRYDLSLTRQKQLSNSYRLLHDKIRAAGLYRAPRPFYGYGPDLLRYTILFLGFFVTHPAFPFLKKHLAKFLLDSNEVSSVETPSTFRCFISAVFLGLWWHQITFVAHDAGHSGITGDWLKDRLIGILIGNFLGGISIGWWCDNHDVHHLVTNHPEHDPDIQHLPFFAISTKFFQSLRSTYYKHQMRFNWFAKISVKYQHRFYYIIMMFGRFNLFFNSCLYLATRKKQKMRNLESKVQHFLFSFSFPEFQFKALKFFLFSTFFSLSSSWWYNVLLALLRNHLSTAAQQSDPSHVCVCQLCSHKPASCSNRAITFCPINRGSWTQ
ncbi:hypothetical protein Pst134EB_024729 [Puccinia striiformis f. sp. tritici]|nr:hypothetical protein Pst134EB_024729 [Puccinia striiformis f. sp. tritici]